VTSHLNILRRAAADVARPLRDDLFDLISEGCENADDTFGERADPDAAEYSDVATATIASTISDRHWAPRFGSTAKAVRDWFFAHDLSF